MCILMHVCLSLTVAVDSAGSCAYIFPEGVSPFSAETVPTVTWKPNIQ